MKTLERMIDKYLTEEVLIRTPLHSNQHAYRKGRTIDTALHALVQKAAQGLQDKEVTLVLFFDVEGHLIRPEQAIFATL